MDGFITDLAALCAGTIEVLGIGIITAFAAYALLNAAVRVVRKEEETAVFHGVRQFLGRGILLGLEFLIAADIIYTVAIDLTFKTVGVLAIIVFIRTFLSFTLEVEINGRWPWQDKQREP